MSTMDKVGNRRSYESLAQLYVAVRRKQHKKFIQFIIDKQQDVNYQIPATDYLQLHLPELIGSTALHLALSQDNFESFNLLLKHGADYNAKNYKQMTVLHRAIEENFNKRTIMQLRHRFNEYDTDFTTAEVNGFVVMQRIIEGDNFNKHDNWRLWGKFEDKYVNSILLAGLETKNFVKCSHDDAISLFHAASLTNNIEAVEFLLKNGADVNAPSSSKIFDGFTPLHFAVKYSSVEVVKIILDNGANLFSHKNNTISALDMLIDQNLKIIEWMHAKNKLPFKSSILDFLENQEKLNAMIDKNFGADWTGFSSFHVACTMTNVSSVPITCSARGQLTLDQFLEGDHWFANDRISSIPTVYPWSGFTALHFAAFFNLDAAKLLIKNGADVEAENKFGVTPLNILETRAAIDDLHFIVSHKESWKYIVLSDGRTKLLDLISSMKNLDTFEHFLDEIDINISIPNDAPLWPGYTVLHLAVTFSETVKKIEFLKNIVNSDKGTLNAEYENCCKEQEISYLERVKLCLKKNPDGVTIQDTRGRTPINLAFRLRNTKAVNLMMQYHDRTVNPTDDDNLSHLHIACLAKNHYLAEKLLANGADVNAAIKSSFKWQCDYHRCTSTDVFDLVGSTPLHLSASSGDFELTKVLLAYGADVNAKDASNMTSLHRIFILLHVWRAGNELYKVPKTVRYICRRGRRVGIPSFSMNMEVLHNLISELLSAPNLKETVVDDFGLSHLHIAVYKDSIGAVKKLLDLGSDMNSVIRCPKNLEANNPLFVLSRYDGYTPLHMTFNTYKSESENYLLERGADFLVPRADGTNQLFEKLKRQYPDNIAAYVSALRENEDLRRRLQDEFGWTILHVACQLVDVELTNFALSIGVDVNFQTNDKSPLHPGFTALHVLMSCHNIDGSEEIETILSLLLANGTDVMLADSRGDTAIHRTHRFSRSAECSYAKSIYAGRLLQHIRNFSVNPTNHEGKSVFHIACIRHDVDVVRKFLDNGVDVNESVEFFSEYGAGVTPLHFAVTHRLDSPDDVELQLRTVELLLKRGADVNVEDAYGETPLHSVAECDPPREAVYEMLVRHGADINVKDNRGRTPLESLLSSSALKSQELEFFLKRGCRMNVFNEITQVGYMSYLYERRNYDDEDPSPMDTLRRAALSCPSIHEVDYRGRTAIHNLVSSSDYEDDLMIGYFMERGCDIDGQDESGMTALHLTTQFRNCHGVEALLSHGCDINVIDSTGRTAFSHALDDESWCDLVDVGGHNHHLAIESFARFTFHMNLRSLRVNDVNNRAFVRALSEFSVDAVEMEEDYENIRREKIGDTAFVLEDFLSETRAIVRYSKIAQEDREVIEQFFTKTIKEYKFHNWDFLCKLQYRKALQRAELVENAKDALNIVIGFPLPDLCYDVVEKYLSNLDLKSLVVAATL